MLHLIFQSSIDDSVLQRIEKGDDVVFYENAVFRLYDGSQLTAELQKMLANGVYFHVLNDELEVRGIVENELISGVSIINYSGLVDLTEKNKVVLTWR